MTHIIAKILVLLVLLLCQELDPVAPTRTEVSVTSQAGPEDSVNMTTSGDGLGLIRSNSSLSTINESYKEYQKVILITGGSGFIGSHLTDSLMRDGHKIIVVDNLHTGRKNNLAQWLDHGNFKLIEDHVESKGWLTNIGEQLDQIYHLASPASPKTYSSNRIYTINTITLGTMNMLDLAKKHKARILLASTSEVYGTPQVHPQVESYWGNVNPVGPRSCYDESKRLAETLAMAYRDEAHVSVAIARIFNTYGPRMRHNDGRVVSNFINQALNNHSITVYGDGSQTRSFLYISDLVSGLKKLMASRLMTPVNLGNTHELSIADLARAIKKLSKVSDGSQISYQKLPIDDPPRRRPDISLAKSELNWRPEIKLEDGLRRTMEHMIITRVEA